MKERSRESDAIRRFTPASMPVRPAGQHLVRAQKRATAPNRSQRSANSRYQRVSYDNAPAASTTAITTEPFGIKRQNFDVDLRFTPRSSITAGIGFSSIKEDRSLRIFEETTENITRLTVDSVGTRWFNLRTKFEHSRKRGTLDQEAFAEMTGAGEQPGMRQYDIADRDRNRATLVGSFLVNGSASANVSVATVYRW